MSTSIDTSLLKQKLAEAALQRQTVLLEAAGSARLPALRDTPAAVAVFSTETPSGTPEAPPLPPPPPPPPSALRDQVNISAQARASLDANRPVPTPAHPPGSGNGPGAGAPHAASAASLRPHSASTAPAWPSTGIAPPLRALLSSLVQQVTAPLQPQRLGAAQHWPASLLAHLETPDAHIEDSPLQIWLVHQGTVYTEQGARGLTLTLRAPQAWLQALPPQLARPALLATPAHPGMPPPPGTTLSASYGAGAPPLQSGTWALVLQPLAPTTARTSALLTLEFQPLTPPAIYGREALLVRQDPWALMATRQANDPMPPDETLVHEREAHWCQTPHCPYQGRAECEQPFCLRLRRVLPAPPPAPPSL